MNPAVETNCRICGSAETKIAGVVEYFRGYAWTVFDCDTCGCRFTRHENAVYDLLHRSGAISYYNDYRELAGETKRLFDRGDLQGLRRFLSETPKYRFIIDETDDTPNSSSLLEVGCSRGYLTAYFILGERNILGADVSSEAIESAQATFGNHFGMADSPAIKIGTPYDIIFHVGMIGCVADPVGLTKELLAMLKPGGKLLFNAPHLAACRKKNQLWFDSAPPPDVVTLYPHGFWQRQFGEAAEVREEAEFCSADQSFALGMSNLFGSWRAPQPKPMAVVTEKSPTKYPDSEVTWRLFERCVSKAARFTRLSNLSPRWPAEFGLFVKMTRR